MEAAILEILHAIRAGDLTLDARWLDKLVRRHNRAAHDGRRTIAKRRLLPYLSFDLIHDLSISKSVVVV